jgi:hypothetical protein
MEYGLITVSLFFSQPLRRKNISYMKKATIVKLILSRFLSKEAFLGKELEYYEEYLCLCPMTQSPSKDDLYGVWIVEDSVFNIDSLVGKMI